LPQRPLPASSQLATLQLLDQWHKVLTPTGLGGCHQSSGLIQQGDPGAIITARLDQIVASASQQPVTILFPGDELVDVADGTQHEVEVFYPFLALAQGQHHPAEHAPQVRDLVTARGHVRDVHGIERLAALHGCRYAGQAADGARGDSRQEDRDEQGDHAHRPHAAPGHQSLALRQVIVSSERHRDNGQRQERNDQFGGDGPAQDRISSDIGLVRGLVLHSPPSPFGFRGDV
jgi:hypothetical protein